MNAPLRTTPSNPPPQPTSSTLASLSTSSGFTASEKKLRRSPYISLARGSDDDDGEFDYEEYYESLGGSGRVFELDCLQTALLEQCSCKECGSGPIEVQEECHRRMGLVIHPYLYCCSCSAKTPIGFKTVGSTKQCEISFCEQVCWWNPVQTGIIALHPRFAIPCI